LMKNKKPPYRELYVPPTGIVARRSTDATAISDPTVAGAMRFIRERACTGIDVGDVLAHLAVSRSTLQRRFHQILKRSIHDAILAERLRKVKELLIETTLSREEIALCSGFSHPEYLSAVFKQQHGVTLMDYRQQYLKTADDRTKIV
jgi:LacI family transcriptional regulator